MIKPMEYKSYPVTFRLQIPLTQEVAKIAEELGYSDSKVYAEFIEGMLDLARGSRRIPKIIRAIWVLRKHGATFRDESLDDLMDPPMAAERNAEYGKKDKKK